MTRRSLAGMYLTSTHRKTYTANQMQSVYWVPNLLPFIIRLATAHSKLAHLALNPRACPLNGAKATKKIFRFSCPYGTSSTGSGREKGIMYASIAHSISTFYQILKVLGGASLCPAGGQVVDALMERVTSVGGDLWYMPSTKQLRELVQESKLAKQSLCPEARSILHPHWNVKSKNNPWIFYNHHEYMHRMRTPKAYPDPPSARILHLVSYVFDQWQTHWYFRKITPAIPHLREAWKVYGDPDIDIEQVMGPAFEGAQEWMQIDSLRKRKMWADRITLTKLFTTADLDTTAEDENWFGNLVGKGLGFRDCCVCTIKN